MIYEMQFSKVICSKFAKIGFIDRINGEGTDFAKLVRFAFLSSRIFRMRFFPIKMNGN